jgi:hypothetical protein
VGRDDSGGAVLVLDDARIAEQFGPGVMAVDGKAMVAKMIAADFFV